MKVKVIKHGNAVATHRRTKYEFYCPGCKRTHRIDDRWSFNGDKQKPTFAPSVDFTGGRYDDAQNYIKLHCHSYVEKGMIRFLNDCSHELAGQTVELPDLNKI